MPYTTLDVGCKITSHSETVLSSREDACLKYRAFRKGPPISSKVESLQIRRTDSSCSSPIRDSENTASRRWIYQKSRESERELHGIGSCVISQLRFSKAVAVREKESGQLHWPDVSQDLRHLGSRFRFGLV